MSVLDRLQHGWNAFMNKDPTSRCNDYGYGGTSYRPDRIRLTRGNERSIVTSIYNRIALDFTSVSMQHIKLDGDGRYLETINSPLNNCLTLEANLDQTGKAFLQDACISMMDEGCIALVPTDTSTDPEKCSFDVDALRTGKILTWYPTAVKARVYNEQTGKQEDIMLLKRTTAIIENPFSCVMNESNSTMQRLIRKLNLLDAIDEQSGAGKLDLIVQLPFSVKSPARRQMAENRRKDIEVQLSGSKYGIAYTDATEHVTQLNRPVDNNLMQQIEYLTSMLYSQLGLTQSILDGTADDKTMTNYYSRIIEPILSAFADEMKRKFLTKTARTQLQSIGYYREAFKLVPVSQIAEIADKFTRNEITTSNEIRQAIGMRPSKDPKADELRNKNLSEPTENQPTESLLKEPVEETKVTPKS